MSGWKEADVANLKRVQVAIPAIPRAKGRLRQPKGMNKTETMYAAHLELGKRVGSLLWYRFEGITLKLGDDCRYTADFAVMMADGSLEIHDTKALWKSTGKPHWEDDARAKMAAVAEQYPFRVLAVWQEANGEWGCKEF